jgi:hypothetical protein
MGQVRPRNFRIACELSENGRWSRFHARAIAARRTHVWIRGNETQASILRISYSSGGGPKDSGAACSKRV